MLLAYWEAARYGAGSYKVEPSESVTKIRVFKNGNFDITFKTSEQADRVAEALHPPEPGIHHNYESVTGTVYERCCLCGRARRSPQHSQVMYIYLQWRTMQTTNEYRSRPIRLPESGRTEDAAILRGQRINLRTEWYRAAQVPYPVEVATP